MKKRNILMYRKDQKPVRQNAYQTSDDSGVRLAEQMVNPLTCEVCNQWTYRRYQIDGVDRLVAACGHECAAKVPELLRSIRRAA